MKSNLNLFLHFSYIVFYANLRLIGNIMSKRINWFSEKKLWRKMLMLDDYGTRITSLVFYVLSGAGERYSMVR